MWYRRITEHHDLDSSAPASQLPVDFWQMLGRFGKFLVDSVMIDVAMPARRPSQIHKRESVLSDDIKGFKRVRLISRKTHFRNPFIRNPINMDHVSRDPPSLATCLICSKSFKRIADLARHARSHHSNRPAHPCTVPGCDYKGSYRKGKLQWHIRNYHTPQASI